MLSRRPWEPIEVLLAACWIWLGLSAGAMVLHLADPFPVTKGMSAEAKELAEAFKLTSEWRLFAFGVGVFCMQGVTFMAVAALLRRHRAGWSETFGFREPGRGRALGLAAAVAVAAVPVTTLFSIGSAKLMSSAGVEPETQQAVQLVEAQSSHLSLWLLGVVAVLLAPPIEELLFRGVLYPTVKQMGRPRLAFFGTSLLFALVHANVMTFVPLTLLAFALVWLYETTNNLLAPIVAHGLFNAANFILISLQITPV